MDDLEERRQYFRITDNVHLSWRELSDEEFAVIAARPEHERADPCSLVAQLHSLSAQAGNLLATIRKSHPDIAHYLTLLDRKIDLVGRLLEDVRFDGGRDPNAEVSISAGGISFASDHPVAEGSRLDMRVILFPSHLCVHPYGDVVYCHELKAGGFRIGVEFTIISEPEQEALVRHVMARQSAQRRRAKNPDV